MCEDGSAFRCYCVIAHYEILDYFYCRVMVIHFPLKENTSVKQDNYDPMSTLPLLTSYISPGHIAMHALYNYILVVFKS